MKDKLKKYDKAILGVIFGLVLPVFGFLLSYPVLTREINMPFDRYLSYAVNGVDRQNIMIFCMLPNMFLFYLVNFRWSLVEFTKGLVAMTLLFGLLLVILSI